MAKKGQVGGRQKLPPDQAERIAAVVKDLLAVHRYTLREAAKVWGIDYSSLSRAQNASGSVGVGFLVKLRSVTGRSIDDLLGLEPLTKRAPQPATTTTPDVPAPADPAWAKRDEAIRKAKAGLDGAEPIPDQVIARVCAKYQAAGYQHRKTRWWEGAFEAEFIEMIKGWLAAAELRARRGKKTEEPASPGRKTA